MAMKLPRPPQNDDELPSRALPPEKLKRHVMVSRDIESMTGVCRKCGPVKLYKRSNNFYQCESMVRRTRDAHLKRRYGLTSDDFDSLVEKNGPACVICGTDPDLFHVDHDHNTGRVRGVLCGDCNRGIGIFKESPAVLRSAIAYLEANHDTETA